MQTEGLRNEGRCSETRVRCRRICVAFQLTKKQIGSGMAVDRIPRYEYPPAPQRASTKDKLLSNHPEAKLLIIDPIMDYLGPAKNSDKATEVRRVLSPLRSLAERHQVAIAAMNHLNKQGRGFGSFAY